jgi:methyl-accepting chemotaxis protein
MSGPSEPSRTPTEPVRRFLYTALFGRRPHYEAELTACKDKVEQQRAEIEGYRKALDEVQAVCAAAAQGDLEPRILNAEEHGPLGHVAHSINHLLDLTDAYVRESTAALDAASEGRYYRRFLTRGMLGSFGAGARTINTASSDMERQHHALGHAEEHRHALASAFEHTVLEIVDSVASAAGEASRSAQSLAETAGGTHAQTRMATEAAERVVQQMEATAAASLLVARSVDAIETQVAQADDSTRAAVASIENVSGSLAGLTESSRAIGEVVALIEDIATQTRLLALNAAIEAARAGDAGRGFAVVADEVGKLAARTAEATGRISHQVQAIQAATGGAAGAIDALVESTVRSSKGIGTAVTSQRSATREIDAGLREASAEARGASEALGLVQGATEDAGAAAEQMNATAEELARMASQLQQAVAGFLDDLGRATPPAPSPRNGEGRKAREPLPA